MGRLASIAAAALALLGVGCAGDLLYFATHTKVGVSITGTGDQISEATFGYDRFEGTFIPVRKDRPGGLFGLFAGKRAELLEEAPSVFACSAIDNQWFGGLSIHQTFATGEAAALASESAHEVCDALLEEK